MAESDARTVGEITDDTGIHGIVKTRLLRDDQTQGLRIDVEVDRGIVTLFGRVSSETERRRALELAGSVKGVVEVEDRLVVVE